AHKEWGGLLSSLYLTRWKLFCDHLLRNLKGEKLTAPDFFAVEKQWSEGPELYPRKQLSKTEVDGLIGRILAQEAYAK
ncbi:MAG TPA: alpha-N-acetylglucosaminidase C-terminal domain-containing protein, partial [Flavisolibacter sp.]|nr:alpha-N-acetylglucosaminidase C-terminal domain-containing protein [Flavisolibacter sp.]